MELDVCDELFIQPAAGDDGLAIGAGKAVAVHEDLSSAKSEEGFFSPYLGQGTTIDDIEGLVNESKLNYDELDADEVADSIAADIAEGKLVGHFAGRMEFGPRALGNRSILADP
jgi:carbamoyltransferase